MGVRFWGQHQCSVWVNRSVPAGARLLGCIPESCSLNTHFLLTGQSPGSRWGLHQRWLLPVAPQQLTSNQGSFPTAASVITMLPALTLSKMFLAEIQLRVTHAIRFIKGRAAIFHCKCTSQSFLVVCYSEKWCTRWSSELVTNTVIPFVCVFTLDVFPSCTTSNKNLVNARNV